MEFVGGWLAVTIIAFVIGCLAGWWIRTLWPQQKADGNHHHSSNRSSAYTPGASSYVPTAYAQQAAPVWHGPSDKMAGPAAIYKDTNPVSDTAAKHVTVPMTLLPEQMSYAKAPGAAVVHGAGVVIVGAAGALQDQVKLATAPPSSTRPQHKRDASTASMYDVEELDNEWESLLEMVDAELAKTGMAPMDMKERQVAVKKLTAVTGTRGMQAALQAAVEEVKRFRSWNNKSAASQA